MDYVLPWQLRRVEVSLPESVAAGKGRGGRCRLGYGVKRAQRRAIRCLMAHVEGECAVMLVKMVDRWS